MKFELVFIPYPGIGHLRSTVEMAKLLVARETRLSISVIIPPFISGGEVGASDYVAALSAASNNRLRYEIISAGDETTAELTSIDIHIKNQVPKVKRAVAKLVDDYSTLPDSPRIVGFVLDMFCTSMIDVANEFGVPSYLFYTSSAGILALGYHIQMLYDENKYDVSESGYLDSEAVLNVPSLNRPYPVKCLPHALASKVWLPMLVNQARKFREMKGILINTVTELEADVLKFLSSGDTPPVYPVGPLLHLENQVDDSKDEKQLDILRWLDEQAPSSVVFLCFGSMGGFGEEQAREIAIALERSGHRFLWSLRRASPNILKEPPREFTNLEEVLPEGFFDRTKDIGKVIGWAPQVAVLANPAIGGFVTHCGWNSTLESLWFGVPTAAWPLYAEQKFNAFEMVEELGLAVEIRKYWRGDHFEGPAMVMVTAEEIETAIKCLMEQDNDVRKRVKEMSENCHAALTDGGSSRTALQKFIEDVTKNIVSMDKHTKYREKQIERNKEMKIKLAFIPSPAISHLMATVEMAEQLVDQNDHLSITVIIISFNSKSTSMIFTSLTTTSNKRIRYEIISGGDQQPTELKATDSHIQSLKPLVRDAVAKLVDPTQPDSPRLAGFIVDMYCTSMIDVANEFGVPSYLFYTSNAGFLGLLLHIQFMYDSEDTYDMSDLEDSDAELVVPSLTCPYPLKCLPYIFKSKEWLSFFVTQARRFRETKGILVNTVPDVEPQALKFLSNGDTPRAYPVGPLLHLNNKAYDSVDEKQSEILHWLDEQPPRSVVFLCFRSMGGFSEEQAREIAVALDRSGHRFLWSLRRASPNIMKEPPGEFTNLEEILPEGFLDRTEERGKVTGWAPQVVVLAKPAIGGFVSHGGWNSTLESLWFGVPMAIWPLYAEQKFNAFEMVEELGLAVEIRKHWRGDLLLGRTEMEIVTAEEIERGLMCLMEQDSDVRKRVKEMSGKCHVALMDGGSSETVLKIFVEDVMENIT